MSQSRRSRRMQQHHKRRNQAGLNLVSLMDIFTILVFFLLVNSSESEVLPNAKILKLPDSIAEKKPKENLVIVVSNTDVIVQGRPIVSINTFINSKKNVIPELKKELDHHFKRAAISNPSLNTKGGEITLMGDHKIPYKILKKIMITSTASKFSNISLAVMQKSANKDG